MGEMSTLFHSVEVGNNILDLIVLIRYVHGIVELYIFGFEFGLEDFESL